MSSSGVVGVVRPCLAVALATASACTIWVALDDPYKRADDGSAPDSSVLVDTDGGDAADVISSDAAPSDGSDRDVVRIVDAGFTAFGLAAYGESFYAVDDQAQVHVASGAGTFTDFWVGDAGGSFFLQTNELAASAAGVFWTLSTGIRYCALDGGTCGLLATSTSPRAIAARETTVAWVDDTGVRVCNAPLDSCKSVPPAFAASRGAQRVAVGPGSEVAWTDGGTRLHFAGDLGTSFVDLPSQASLVATDEASGYLYWVGSFAVGALPFDGGVGETSALTSRTAPTALFASSGVAYFSLHASNSVSYCSFDDGGSCVPREDPSGVGVIDTTCWGIVANSKKLLALFSADVDPHFQPVLVGWRLP